jgi:DamX protein
VSASGPSQAPVTYQKARTREDLLWLAEQNPSHLTIQLIALKKFAAVEAYLQSHQLEGANVIATGPVVIAVFGSFPDMASAMTGLSQLPIDIVAQGYWIRSIGDVQADARR